MKEKEIDRKLEALTEHVVDTYNEAMENYDDLGVLYFSMGYIEMMRGVLAMFGYETWSLDFMISKLRLKIRKLENEE